MEVNKLQVVGQITMFVAMEVNSRLPSDFQSLPPINHSSVSEVDIFLDWLALEMRTKLWGAGQGGSGSVFVKCE